MLKVSKVIDRTDLSGAAKRKHVLDVMLPVYGGLLTLASCSLRRGRDDLPRQLLPPRVSHRDHGPHEVPDGINGRAGLFAAGLLTGVNDRVAQRYVLGVPRPRTRRRAL
jgi:hypothetical protein